MYKIFVDNIEEITNSNEKFFECLFNDLLAYQYNQLLSVLLSVSSSIKSNKNISKTTSKVEN